jgi:SSS family solute:Na+ symporter
MFVTQRSKTLNELLNAKRGLSVLLLIPLVMSETVGGAATVGNTAEAMKIGMSAVWATTGLALGIIGFMAAFSRFYRVLGVTKGVVSLPNAYEIIFDKRTKILMMGVVCVVYTILFAIQPVSAAAIFAPMLGIHPNLITIVVGIIFIIVTVKGGLKGLASMNVIHCAIMLTGIVIAAFFILKKNGFTFTLSQVDPKLFSFVRPSVLTVVLWIIGNTLSQMSSALMVNVCLAGKTLRMVQKGFLFGSLLIILFAFFPPFLGVIAKTIMPEVAPNTALYVLADSAGPVISGIISMAIIAAIFSTAPALLLVVSGTLARDFYKEVFKPTATDREVVKFAKISAVVIGVAAVFLGAMTKSIFGSYVGAFQIRSIAGIVLLIALAWPRVNATAGFWSILLGGGLAAVWHFAGNPFGLQPLVPSLVLGVLILVIITLSSKEKVSKGYQVYSQLKKEYKEKYLADENGGKLAADEVVVSAS